MLDKCWQKDPNDRVTFEELKEILGKFESNAHKGIDGYEEPNQNVGPTERTNGINENLPNTTPLFEVSSTVNANNNLSSFDQFMNLPLNAQYKSLENEQNTTNQIKETCL